MKVKDFTSKCDCNVNIEIIRGNYLYNDTAYELSHPKDFATDLLSSYEVADWKFHKKHGDMFPTLTLTLCKNDNMTLGHFEETMNSIKDNVSEEFYDEFVDYLWTKLSGGKNIC